MDNLDDPSQVRQNDGSDFYALVEDFPDQCRRTHEIALKASLPNWTARPDHVLLTGLGGSAAGGDLTKALYDAEGRVPFFVNRDYHVPAFVGTGSLVFAASYSGNTEETLSAYADARRRGASIIAVTSGGQLAEMAREDGFPVVIVPGGQAPRTALGYMFIPLVLASQKLGLIDEQRFQDTFSELDQAGSGWKLEVPEAQNEAKQLAKLLSGKLALLYGLGSWQWAVAQRWKGQINENAKEMVFTHSFPELCHNEILGWEGSGSQGVKEWVAVLLQDGHEANRLQDRVRLTVGLLKDRARFATATAQGTSLLAKMLTLAHLSDYVSVYMAALAHRDPAQMDAIINLKNQLAALG